MAEFDKSSVDTVIEAPPPAQPGVAGVGYRDIVRGLHAVGVKCGVRPVIAHVSLSALGRVKGGAGAVVAALSNVASSVVVPTFTYQTMVVPETGPPDNGMTYGGGAARNELAAIWSPDLPVHEEIGQVAEQLRRQPGAARSDHPVLSFAALGAQAEEIIAAQTLDDPYAPISWLAEHEGDVLLLGVGHRVNTSIHVAERLAGRKSFVRWALTAHGVVEVPQWPGNSAGFDALAPHIEDIVERGQIGTANVQRIPVGALIEKTLAVLRADPYALLTDDPNDERAAAIRRAQAAV